MNEFTLPIVIALLSSLTAIFLAVINIFTTRNKNAAEVNLAGSQIIINLRDEIEALSSGLDDERRLRRKGEDRITIIERELGDEKIKTANLELSLKSLKEGCILLVDQLRNEDIEPIWIPDQD